MLFLQTNVGGIAFDQLGIAKVSLLPKDCAIFGSERKEVTDELGPFVYSPGLKPVLI